MDPTSKKQPKTKSKTTTLKKPYFFSSPQDPIVPSSTLNKITAQYSKWNTNHNHVQRPFSPATAADPPPCVDTHLQVKAMTISANADSSSLSLLKNNPCHRPQSHRQQKKQVDMERKQSKTEEIEREKAIIPRERDEPSRPSVSLQSTRRKSFCDSQMELGEFFSTVSVKVVAVDMPPFMQIHAVTCARKTYDGLDKHLQEPSIDKCTSKISTSPSSSATSPSSSSSSSSSRPLKTALRNKTPATGDCWERKRTGLQWVVVDDLSGNMLQERCCRRAAPVAGYLTGETISQLLLVCTDDDVRRREDFEIAIEIMVLSKLACATWRHVALGARRRHFTGAGEPNCLDRPHRSTIHTL